MADRPAIKSVKVMREALPSCSANEAATVSQKLLVPPCRAMFSSTNSSGVM